MRNRFADFNTPVYERLLQLRTFISRTLNMREVEQRGKRSDQALENAKAERTRRMEV